MGAYQRELCARRVVKNSAAPCRGGMACLAFPGESGLDVIRICRGRELGIVAIEALGGRSGIAATYVAASAFQGGVGSGECESCHRLVIETGAAPGIHPVAAFAFDGKATASVRRILGLGEIGRVAGRAIRAESEVLSHRGSAMAALARYRRMRADEWETIGMLASLLDARAPTLDGMAILAAASELPAVNVGVAGGTRVTHLLKDSGNMAAGTGYSGVHAAQGIARLGIVIELRLGAQGPPTAGRVARLAGDFERPMRVACPVAARRCLARQQGGAAHECG